MNFFIKKNEAFFWPYLAFLILFLPVILFIPKGEFHIFLNTHHCIFGDYFFRMITSLGDGLVPVILALLFIFISLRKAFILAGSGVLAGIIAQVFKRLVFSQIVRPVKFFESSYDLYLVEGVDMHSSFSFPSGHSATIFALCLSLVYFVRKDIYKFLLFILALVVAMSRVYLSQHFFTDIYAGSVLGIFSAMIIYTYLEKIDNSWIDKNIVSVFKKP
ncbi:MAG: phosphatase PAP2 family protein [Bacteroidales bacterium]|nr:phosphatase PAP2 family protein [Bacteroidales bacterium]